MKWILLYVAIAPNHFYVDALGIYDTHDECLVAMHEAEIAVSDPSEGMNCLLFDEAAIK